MRVKAVQKRIATTSSVLAGMRSIKMMGLSRPMAPIIQNQSVEESHRMAAHRWSIVWQDIVQNLPWILAPALTFTVYAVQATAHRKSSIGTAQASTSLSSITLLAIPTAKLLRASRRSLRSLGASIASRTYLFCLGDKMHDTRPPLVRHPLNSISQRHNPNSRCGNASYAITYSQQQWK